MNLPGWLASLTNASKFAAPGGMPNFGDALQGIGNSMMNHYRYGTNQDADLAKIAQIKGDQNLPGMRGSNPSEALLSQVAALFKQPPPPPADLQPGLVPGPKPELIIPPGATPPIAPQRPAPSASEILASRIFGMPWGATMGRPML